MKYLLKILQLTCQYMLVNKVVAEDLQHHVHKIEKMSTSQNILRYLIDEHFVQILNISIIRDIFKGSDEIMSLINTFEHLLQEFHQTTDLTVLMKIFSTHPDLSPKHVNGLPKLILTLQDPFTSVSIFEWNNILQQTLNHTEHIYLSNITQSSNDSINVEYVVLPYAVSDLLKSCRDNNELLQQFGVIDIDCRDLEKFSMVCIVLLPRRYVVNFCEFFTIYSIDILLWKCQLVKRKLYMRVKVLYVCYLDVLCV